MMDGNCEQCDAKTVPNTEQKGCVREECTEEPRDRFVLNDNGFCTKCNEYERAE